MSLKSYELRVFVALAAGGMLLHVFDIQVARPVAWVKAHADEMAQQFMPDDLPVYVALGVSER